MKKTKILILNVEQFKHETMLTHELKELAEKYEVLLANSIMDALDKIAKAKLREKNPIYGLVFQRDTLASNKERCRVVSQFAEYYANKFVIAINMIWNDQDKDARIHAVSAHYCRSDNWDQVKNIFDNNIKK